MTLWLFLAIFGFISGQGVPDFRWTSDDEKYMISIGDLKTWEGAFENCITMNRTLVTIQDETEHFELLDAGRVPRTRTNFDGLL